METPNGCTVAGSYGKPYRCRKALGVLPLRGFLKVRIFALFSAHLVYLFLQFSFKLLGKLSLILNLKKVIRINDPIFTHSREA